VPPIHQGFFPLHGARIADEDVGGVPVVPGRLERAPMVVGMVAAYAIPQEAPRPKTCSATAETVQATHSSCDHPWPPTRT
jgi:hypothetical protein